MSAYPIYNLPLFGFNRRLKVKTFKTSADRAKWLNKQLDNTWRELPPVYGGCTLPTKAGTYVSAAGVWHNIKTIDPLLLPHF